MRIHIKKGVTLPIQGEPELRISVAKPVQRVALLAADFLTFRHLPRVLVEEGERVQLGQPLIQCKNNPAIVATAPGSGVVEKIIRGKRRSLKAITIHLEGDEARDFTVYSPAQLPALTEQQVRDQLLASGLWLSLRTRPYSLTPCPDETPAALFINAMDTQPLAAPPEVIIGEAADEFICGLQVLSRLGSGKQFLCVNGKTTDAQPWLEAAAACCQVVQFSGHHPAGATGTHIHHLMPVHEGRTVWSINYQDVIAVGRLFTTGRLPTERVISLAGPKMEQPRLVRTRLGACVDELLAGEIKGDRADARLISGSVLAGREASGWGNYLGWFHHQVCAIHENPHREPFAWLSPGAEKFSLLRAFVSHLLPGRQGFAMDGNYHGHHRAMLPIGAYERVMPLDLLITPLLRALLVGDVETALELGCLELDEEDLALCSFVCPSKHDFGFYLREMLDKVEKELA